ncbi:MAG TPA: glycerol-3-phosphate dehydrogenase C-terminal domain-containing protein, partial [Dongiaceae bacterium]
RYLKPPRPSQTARETLPGGDIGADGMAAFEAAIQRDFPWLPGDQARRYVRLYGTRTRALLESVRLASDLGTHFGADLYQREVDFLVATEWAQSADDILWRRTKLGLRLTAAEVVRLETYLQNRQEPVAAAAS